MLRRFVTMLATLAFAAVLVVSPLGSSFHLGIPGAFAQTPTPTVAASATAKPATTPSGTTSPTPSATPAATTPMRRGMHPLPAELAFLASMTAQQRFESVLSAQMTFRNPQGQNVVLNATPGVVSSVGNDQVAITPNGASTTHTFNVTSTTWVM